MREQPYCDLELGVVPFLFRVLHYTNWLNQLTIHNTVMNHVTPLIDLTSSAVQVLHLDYFSLNISDII